MNFTHFSLKQRKRAGSTLSLIKRGLYKGVVNATLFILNPDDYERGRMSPNGTHSFGTRDVWYIKPPDTLNGCLFVC